MLLFSPHKRVVSRIRFSPDGRQLLTTSSDSRLHALDALTGELAWRVPDVTCADIACSPDGGTVAHIAGKWTARRFVIRAADTGIERGSFSLDSDAFVVTPDHEQVLFVPQTYYSESGKWVARVKLVADGERRVESLPMSSQGDHRIVVSRDGRRAAVRSFQQFVLVNLETWAVVGTSAVSNDNNVHYGVQFAPDGRTVVFSIGPHLYVWDAETGAEVREIRDKGRHVQALTFTPDGRYLFTVSNDETVKVRATATWDVAKEYTWKTGPLRSVEVSPDGTLAAAGSVSGTIVVWDVDL